MVRIDDRPGIRFSIRQAVRVPTPSRSPENVNKELAEIVKFFPNIRIQPIFDSSKFITQSINNLRESATSGGPARDLWRCSSSCATSASTLIVAASIPITIIGTFMLMYAGGFTPQHHVVRRALRWASG
jgi:HAE1 family hydrophobic/amphiphilic exporter-1